MKKLFLALSAAFCLQASAQTEVNNYQPGVTVEGVNYFLPRTLLRITIEAEKSVVTPGDLNKYAFRYLRISDVAKESSTTWKIKNVTIEPYGAPDSSKAYNIKLKGRTIAPMVALTREGIILSINAEKQETVLPALPQGTPASAILNSRQYLNQEMLSAGSTAKLAELCAQEIYDIRESRNDLIRGEAENTPKDGAQLQLMLDQLDTQAKALEQLFTGTTQTATEVFSLTYDPQQETAKEVLFRFSQMAGVVDKDDLSGSPVYISITNTGSLPQTTDNTETDKKKAKMQEKGVYYNVPMREKIQIFDAGQTYVQTEVSMGQFGNVEILSDALFNKNTTTRVYFYQENGGLQKIEQ